MVVNDNAYLLDKRGVIERFASELAPTQSISEQQASHCEAFFSLGC
jgi:hypothetical protein